MFWIIVSLKDNFFPTAPELTAELNFSWQQSVSLSTTKKDLDQQGSEEAWPPRTHYRRWISKKDLLAKRQGHWKSGKMYCGQMSPNLKLLGGGGGQECMWEEKQNEEWIIPTVKPSGLSVMVLSHFGGKRVGELIQFNGQ